MSVPHENLFVRAPNNANMRVFGYAAYAHKHKTKTSKRFPSRVGMGVFTGNRDYMHCIYYPGRRKLLFTTHGTYNVDIFPLFSDGQDLYTLRSSNYYQTARESINDVSSHGPCMASN